MMSEFNEDIFKLLPDDEKFDIVNLFVKYFSEILFKFEDSGVFRSRVLHYKIKDKLIVKLPLGFSRFYHGELATVNFSIQNEKFFFKSLVAIHEDRLELSLGGAMFHLQRRKNKRLDVPTHFANQFKVMLINQRKTDLGAKIIDFSYRGARVEMPQQIPQLKTGNFIVATVKIGNRRPVEIDATVRHHRNINKGRINCQLFGIEFLNIDTEREKKIQTLFDDIYREKFNQLKKTKKA